MLTREQLAIKHGMKLSALNNVIKGSWADFPAPVHKIGVRLYYNEEECGFYIEQKLAARGKLMSDRLKKKSATPDAGYFGGQKFLSVKGMYEWTKIPKNLNARNERDKACRLSKQQQSLCVVGNE
jgi:hypothetical protein